VARTWFLPRLDWLLVFVPAALGLEFFAPEQHTWIFLSACLAVMPLAHWMGKATEHLAERTGEGVGGLLNATFGNAAELIIALLALHKGEIEIVKASLTGSIIGNVLLVLGAALLAGGLKYDVQRFNAAGARVQTTMLTLALAALVVPAAHHHLAVESPATASVADEANLSVWVAGVLLLTYVLGLVFSLYTHKDLFGSAHGAEKPAASTEAQAPDTRWSVGRSLGILLVATALVALVSECLIGSVQHAAEDFGMSEVFVGVVVVAVVGNAAEHSTAVLVARKNRMDLSLGIAVGSSIQVALFVAPILVFASYLMPGAPLDLVFSAPEVLAVGLTAILAAQIAGDGQCNWLEGVQLLAVYVVLALLFYFLG
jgi:Ca2+:H+ antiporter